MHRGYIGSKGACTFLWLWFSFKRIFSLSIFTRIFSHFDESFEFFQKEVTLSKTLAALGRRNILLITVVASSAAKLYIGSIKSRSIKLLEETAFSLKHSVSPSKNRLSMYPRKVIIKMQNFTLNGPNDEATVPEGLVIKNESMDFFHRRKETTDGLDLYTLKFHLKRVWKTKKRWKT